MATLFEMPAVEGILQRIENLTPAASHKWGKMDVAQMLAHCSAPLELALGDKQFQRSLFAKLLGPFFKNKLTNDVPFEPNLPTDKHYIVADDRSFEKEKMQLITLIKRFNSANPAEVAAREHLFLGKITANEWGRAMHKHLDHHLRQFGV